MNDRLTSALAEAAAHQLQKALESDSTPEDGMTFCEAHGYLTAQAIQPGPFDPDTALAELFGSAAAVQPAQVREAVCGVYNAILQQLINGEPPDLPCDPESELDPDAPPLQGWATGFMEAFFLQPEAWSGPPEELVGELTLPMLSVSGLLDDEELHEIAQDSELVMNLCQQIPDLVVDLFLLYQAPDTH